MSTRPAHLAFLEKHAASVKLGGPFLEGDKPVGSMLILECDNEAAARALLAEDPYAEAGLFERGGAARLAARRRRGAVVAHWLLKSEPSTWSWDQQVAAGAKGTFWNGVRNHLAKQHLMAMKKGERGFFYHSNDERAIVGVVEVIKTYYPDHTDETGKFGMVDVKAVKALKKPVSGLGLEVAGVVPLELRLELAPDAPIGVAEMVVDDRIAGFSSTARSSRRTASS